MKLFFLILFLISSVFTTLAQSLPQHKIWKVDSIKVKKNWRTRHKIILREIQFNRGDSVDRQRIETSINQIWTPMIPCLSASVFFSYLKGSNNWFNLAI